MSVIHIHSKEEFQKHIEAGPAIVDFSATWCGPCRFIAPKYAEMAKHFPNIQFLEVDVDQDLCAELEIQAMPTFFAYKGGIKVAEIVGADMNGLLNIVKTLE